MSIFASSIHQKFPSAFENTDQKQCLQIMYCTNASFEDLDEKFETLNFSPKYWVDDQMIKLFLPVYRWYVYLLP